MFVGLPGSLNPSLLSAGQQSANYYSAESMEARYRATFGTSKSGGRWTDTDRLKRAATLTQRSEDAERMRRAKAILQRLKDEPRIERGWKTKAERDRQLPRIERPADAVLQTAYHESGHALLQVLGDGSCGLVTVVPNEDSVGHMQRGFRHGSRSCRIKMGMAGPLSAAKFRGQRWEPGSATNHFGDGHWTDYGDLPKIEQYCSRNSVEFQKLRTEVERTLEEYWPLVECVANLLVEHHTLLGTEVAAMVADYRTTLLAA